METFLETDRLLLRQFTAEDTDELFDLSSNPDVVRFTSDAFQSPTYSVVQAQVLPKYSSYYERYESYGVWAAVEKASQSFIGWFKFIPAFHASYFDQAFDRPNQIELGYRLLKPFWGKGYATEGAKALVQKGFSKLGIQSVVAVTFSKNLASMRVLEKAGLNQIRYFTSKSGNEIIVYALNRDEFRGLREKTRLLYTR